MTLDLINKQMIARSFGKAAPTYDSVAHFQRWVGEGLLSRIPDIDARRILDLGCGTGHFLPDLHNRFPDAELIGLDLSEQMLQFARKQCPETKVQWLLGDGESLPLKNHSVDLIFSSLSIQWCGNLGSLFGEIERVLSDRGVFVFTSLLDGTLAELKTAWAKVDDAQHVNEFAELQDYQRAIDASGLSVDCLASELRVLPYSSVNALTRELKKLGAHNMTPHRVTHVTGRERVRQFLAAYDAFRLNDGRFPATYNVLWGGVSKNRANNKSETVL